MVQPEKASVVGGREPAQARQDHVGAMNSRNSCGSTVAVTRSGSALMEMLPTRSHRFDSA
ncbi:MAG: hypothetical protein ACXWVP_11585 [Burkholderiales bacterium]